MRRREALAFVCGMIAAPRAVLVQAHAGKRSIGFLHPRTVATDSPTVRELRPAWEGLGYAAPETVLLRSADEDLRRLPGPARQGYWPRAVVLADRILKRENPGELPIERPSQFEVVVNLRAARALDLVLPDSLLLADEAIE